MRSKLCVSIIALILVAVQAVISPAMAQDGKLKTEELDQLLAPIALYPDDLLTNVLVASTYPLEVVQAARWKKEPANAKLNGDALAKALEAKDWDPSVKSLVQFPGVLQTMNDKLEWTQKLGDAFLAQQDDVMDEVQVLRAKADEAGYLKNNTQQKITRETNADAKPVYIIEPANPDTIYVPVYQPTIVYGSWWYPDFPPYYWARPGASFVNGFFWGAGVAVARSIWGWGHWDWRRRDIDINVNKWNNINVNRPQITSTKWTHNPAHRGQVPYKGKDVRDKFKSADRGAIGSKEFRGRDKGDVDRAKIGAKLKDGDRSQIKDRIGEGAGQKIKDRTGDGAGERIKDRVGDGAGAKLKDKSGNRADKKVGDRKVSRDFDRAGARKQSPGAFDIKRGPEVRKNAERGRASRVAMGGGGAKVGGGRSRGGGGGRRR